MYIIVGLGNPGEEYARTRHNTGRMAADFLKNKVSGIKIVTPDTYMNESGRAVAKAMVGKKAKNLIVIYDDLYLPLGTLKISYNRSSGGHKGLESIIRALKTKEFIRIRIGIGKAKDVEKHILSDFKKPELETLKKVFKKATEAVQTMVAEGLTIAMTKFNA